MFRLSRRDFLKAAGASAAAIWLAELGFDLAEARAEAHALRTATAQPVPSICYFCAVGCGVVAHVQDGKIINVEGDPDHPISQGALCSKGQSLIEMVYNPQRLKKVLYRAPGAAEWEEKSWDWALDRIVERARATRDATILHKNEAGVVVNRTEALASLGSAIYNNEECYTLVKLMRALGLVNIEHQARI